MVAELKEAARLELLQENNNIVLDGSDVLKFDWHTSDGFGVISTEKVTAGFEKFNLQLQALRVKLEEMKQHSREIKDALAAFLKETDMGDYGLTYSYQITFAEFTSILDKVLAQN